MASATYFASAFQTTSATDSLPSSSCETNRKRKRDLAASGDDAGGEETEVHSSGGSVTSEPESLGQDATIQYETSGHPIDKTLPRSNFPHAFRQRPTHSSQLQTGSNLSDGLATLRPPLCVAAGSGSNVGKVKPRAVGLRQQHLIAQTAILHRCVLEGDFIRAGRAWGMLLRAEHNGHSLDLRSTDRWGLGAEIILRREAQLVCNKDRSGKPFSLHGTDDQHHMPSDLFSSQAFEQAKDYYERLVLQYPYRKAFPNTTGPQDFHVAMFSLWIYSVEKQHSLALAEIGTGAAGERSDALALDQDGSDSVPHTEQRQDGQRKGVCIDTLQRADVIAARLRELLMSPLYSDNPKYGELQGMIHSWIMDLSNALNSSGSDDEGGDAMSEGSSMSGGDEAVNDKPEYGDIE